jgi:hypothetical protein
MREGVLGSAPSHGRSIVNDGRVTNTVEQQQPTSPTKRAIRRPYSPAASCPAKYRLGARIDRHDVQLRLPRQRLEEIAIAEP